jgi:hypothetical protein
MVATPTGVVLWSLWSRTHEYSRGNFTVYSGIDVFRLVGQRWLRQQIAWPQHQTVDQPVFTGTMRWHRGPPAPSSIAFGMPAVWDGSTLLALAADGRVLSYRP